LLVLGGTVFLGLAYVEEALARGHLVTTFNRGRSAADDPRVEAIHGDRTEAGALDVLRGRQFDAVVDTSGFVPRVVGASARVLVDGTDRYVFISTVGASAEWPARPSDESAPRFDCAADAGPDDGDYGTLKAGCERAVEEVYAERALVVRPGVILGPHENIGRLPSWLDRMARGGRVLAPGDPAEELQLIDGRDIALWTLDLLERGAGEGIYNLVGPPGNATYGSWLGDCVEVTGGDAELVWVEDAFLLEQEVEPWSELPLWLPMDGESDYGWKAPVARAEAEGLRTRPVRETVEDTWAWMQAGGRPNTRADRPRHGLAADKEQRILAAWDARAAH
jgi:2'-hydroxyisoflavone reductase